MKISTKGRYGLRIMLDLAQNGTDRPRMISDICSAQGLSKKYVGRLVIMLRKADMVSSIRGAKGGYKIKRDPKTLSLLEIIEVMEGPVSIVSCISCPELCKKSPECIARSVWGEINEKMKESLAAVTLQEVVDRHVVANHPCVF